MCHNVIARQVRTTLVRPDHGKFYKNVRQRSANRECDLSILASGGRPLSAKIGGATDILRPRGPIEGLSIVRDNSRTSISALQMAALPILPTEREDSPLREMSKSCMWNSTLSFHIRQFNRGALTHREGPYHNQGRLLDLN